MSLPPKSDPRRPLQLAVCSMRVLGLILLASGAILVLHRVAPTVLPARLEFFAYVDGWITSCFCLGPGVAYLVLAIHVKRRRLSSLVLVLGLASIQLLLLLPIWSLGLAATLASDVPASATLVPLIVAAIFIFGLAQLIYYLIESFESIKHIPPQQQRGFEPILLQTSPDARRNLKTDALRNT